MLKCKFTDITKKLRTAKAINKIFLKISNQGQWPKHVKP